MSKLKSRKFWVAIGTALFVGLTEIAGLDIEPETYWAIFGLAATYIAGESWIDSRKIK